MSIPPSKPNDILLARLAEGLDATAQMTQVLLSDLKDSEGDFATMKIELSVLREHVTGLSSLVKDGGTDSLLVKIAQVEKDISHIKDWIDKHADDHQRLKTNADDIKKQIADIESRLAYVENTIKELQKSQKEESEKTRTNSTMIYVTIIVLILTGLGYFTKSCSTLRELSEDNITSLSYSQRT